MGDMLSGMEKKHEKQDKHKQRQANSKAQKTKDIESEKERLNAIAGNFSFQENPLDVLFQHVNNTITQKKKN